MKFPYMKMRGKELPIVPIMLHGKDGWIEYDAFVDSGAGYSVFHYDVVEDLDLKIEDMEKKYVTVGDGSLIIVYTCPIDINIGNNEFKAEMGFSKQLGIGFNIIGRKDIFDRYRICFEEKAKFVEMSHIQ